MLGAGRRMTNDGCKISTVEKIIDHETHYIK